MKQRGQWRPWTVAEEQALRELAALGTHQLSLIFARSRTGVKRKASRLGVSVKRTSQINVTVLSPTAIRRVQTNDPASLCPMCGRRLVAIVKTGLCGVCHKAVLLEAHYQTLAELDTQREINRVKQRVRRTRKELGITAPRAQQAQAETE
jgi:hypothetical protein